MSIQRILIHSGKHPFEPFDSSLDYDRTMEVFGTNSGNLLFADAVFKYLYATALNDIASDGYRFPTMDPDMDPDVLNERFDCVVIPAANWLARYYQAKLPQYAAKIRKLKIPCVVIGLGAQASGRDESGYISQVAPEAKEFLAAVSDKSHSISVRGDFTAECLRRLGFNNAEVTGCPSFYRNLNTFKIEKRPTTREEFRLAVNGNKNLLTGLRAELFERYDSVLFSQGDILKVLKKKWSTPWRDLKKVLGDGFSLNLISKGRVRLYGDIKPWMDELSHYHFSVGTRIHGNIIALLSGTPAMVLAHDSRTSEMAEFYKIPRLPVHSLKPGFDPYELYQSADYTAMQVVYPHRLRNMAAFLDKNGLRHTLFEENGTTYYDMKVRGLNFERSGYEFGGAFFKFAKKLSPAFTGVRAVRGRFRNTTHQAA